MTNTEVKCTKCGRSVEVCVLCQEPGCRHVICRDCLYVALGQAKPRTFTEAESS